MSEVLVKATYGEMLPTDTIAEWLGKIIGQAIANDSNIVEFDIAGQDQHGKSLMLEFRMQIRRPEKTS